MTEITQQPQDPTTVLLVDDHALVRDGLREILEAQGDMVVVCEAGSSHAAVAIAAEKHPHIVLLDIEIPGDEATTTVMRIHRVSPQSQVLILSMYDGPQLLQRLLAVGVRGYLLKSVTMQELVSAIRSVRSGDDKILLAVSRESLAHVHGPAQEVISEREREVLELTAQALSNIQIASRLGLTEATVKRHLRNIFVKLGAVSRIDAVNKAVNAGLIRIESRTPAPHTRGAPADP